MGLALTNDWMCPLCGLKKMPYGTSCPLFETEACENIRRLHITGAFYLNLLRLKQAKDETKGTGISQISDE